MRTQWFPARTLAALAVLALGLAACGGPEEADDDDGGGAAAPTTDAGDGGATDADDGATDEPTEDAPTEEEPADDLFAGKTITILVSFPAGSSPDITSRIIANELGEHLPGNPDVEVRPAEGGGGAVSMRQLSEAGDDGTTLVMATSGVLTRWLFGEEGHDYPLDEMTILTAFPGSNVAVVRNDVGTTLEEVLAHGETLRGANTAIGSTLATNQLLSANLLGIDLRQVFGYPGPVEFGPALERGEVEIANPTDLTFIANFPPLIESGVITPLYQDGTLDSDGNVVRSSIVADVPTTYDLYVDQFGEEPSGQDWDAYEGMLAVGTIAIPLIANQNTTPEHLDALRAAIEQLSQDAEFMEQVETTFNVPVDIVLPDAAATAFDRFTSLSTETVDYLRELSTE
jgi:tripartite-type tricarboxylate transporter receptor subunit TctC